MLLSPCRCSPPENKSALSHTHTSNVFCGGGFFSKSNDSIEEEEEEQEQEQEQEQEDKEEEEEEFEEKVSPVRGKFSTEEKEASI